ncbi:MAG: hypothetical protein K1X33_05495 [Methanobacteriaceae archaeon]|nr:hypothetical protein [Methanobacteriaceae archaeon]
MMVLGINDPWIWSIYILIILSALLCVVYGAINWNKGDDDEDDDIPEDDNITLDDLDSY